MTQPTNGEDLGKNKLNILTAIPPWEWPEDTDKLLLEVLRDPQRDDSERLTAAELAGDYTVINDELADALLTIMANNNENEEIRATAAISFGAALEHAHVYEFDDPDDLLISEPTFHRIQEALHKLYLDAGAPKLVRRRVLEAAIRAPQDWQQDAIRAAYASGDEDWVLTAVFSMRWVLGFDNEILEALESDNEDLFYEAICAAGGAELKAAWPYVTNILTSEREDKVLLVAAIEAAACIRPVASAEYLLELAQSDDEDIVEAAHDAMVMSRGLQQLDDDYDFDDDDDDDEDDDLLF